MKPFPEITYRVGFLAALAFAPHVYATGLKPVYSTDPATIDTCIDWWNNFDASTTCEYVRDLFNISPEQFHEWNPSIGLDCKPWLHPLSYCISTSDRPPPTGVTTTTTTTTVASTTSTTSSTHVPSPTAWEARGCFVDDDPDYPVLETKMSDEGGNPSLDIASCEDLCWKASVDGTVLYAGVKQGNQCWCSSFVAGESVWDESKCDMPCTGDKDEICGGEDYINVFNPVTTTGVFISVSESATQISSEATPTDTAIGVSTSVSESATQTSSQATPTKPANGVETPSPTQPGLVENCGKFHWVQSGESCVGIAADYDVSLSQFLRWNPEAGSACRGLWANAYACVGILPDFHLTSYYHTDCSGDVHNDLDVSISGDDCIDTSCVVGSVDIADVGACPDGKVQISYWEKPGCSGDWFGYGYTSRGQCHKMWTEGWKFKSLHLRCASEAADCVSNGLCTYASEPDHYLC